MLSCTQFPSKKRARDQHRQRTGSCNQIRIHLSWSRTAASSVEVAVTEVCCPARANSTRQVTYRFYIAQSDHLLDVSGDQKIERPSHHHSQLLRQPRQFHQIHSPPKHPRDKAGKFYSKYHGYSLSASDSCQLS